MKLIYCLLILLCPDVKGQLKGPAPGAQVPDIRFANVMNHTATKANLYAFRKRLVIIDFWTGYCSACLKKIPVFDSMQKAHPDELAVLLVSSSVGDTKEKVQRTLKRLKDERGRSIGLPVILGDTLMNNFFPHTYVPHFALLDSNLKVLAVTDADDLPAENIADILKTGKVNFSIDNGIQDFDAERMFLKNDQTRDEILFQTTVSRYSKNAPSSTNITKDSAGRVTKILLTNQSVSDLLKRAHEYFAHPEYITWPKGMEEQLNPRDKPKEWIRANCFTYQLICAPISYDSARAIMRADIERIFGYSAAVRPAVVKEYVLKEEPLSSPQPGHHTITENESGTDMLTLTRLLSKRYGIRIRSELPNDRSIYLSPAAFHQLSLAEAGKLLKEYGLSLSEHERTANSLFIFQTKTITL